MCIKIPNNNAIALSVIHDAIYERTFDQMLMVTNAHFYPSTIA
jgi:hypothetical protein